MNAAGGKSHPVMEIRVSGLSDGEYPFEFDIPASDINLERFDGNIHVKGMVRRVSNQLFLTGAVRGVHVAQCDRCLVETRAVIEAPLEIFYRVPVIGERPEAAGDDTEIRTFLPDQDSIVLDDEARQALLLEIPLKTLCNDDCKGLCPGCGVDLNREQCDCRNDEIDPRWAKLAEVFKNGGKN